MTASVWRLSHLILAIFSFLFILMASITGAILSFDPINEKALPYKVDNFDQITLAQSIPNLQKQYDEILELSIDHNQFVSIDGFDEEGNDIKKIIDPTTGTILGEPIVKSEFIQWVTSLHRSLFLHETGRFIIGFVSFLLLLITVSGTVLIVKRQQGVKNFFAKITKDYFAQYYHVVAGRLLLLPILIISLTGTYLFMLRFEMISTPEVNQTEIAINENQMNDPMEVSKFPAFQSIYLKDIEKVEFPFDTDPSEFYKIKYVDKEILVDQYSGNIVAENLYPKSKVLETWSLNLHTGKTNAVWAIILGIASVNILFFIWSGFVITFKRTRTKVAKNKVKATEAECIILVGSEGGTTLGFANAIHDQLLSQGKLSYLVSMNEYQVFPNAKHLLVLTSTYGIGDAPTNAKKFENLLHKFPQNQNVKVAVVGFGSRAYTEFCGYAIRVSNWLKETTWAKELIVLKTINDRSPEEFTSWVKEINQELETNLSITPANYVGKKPKVKSFKVLNKTSVSGNDTTFRVIFETKQKYQSGDLLAIYPDNDYKERLYSIGKVNGKLQLVVKLHEMGLGSQFLYNLKPNEQINARLVKNKSFHVPKKAKEIILIANGTGIAPFLGMISENTDLKKMQLYAGFRFSNHATQSYQKFAEEQLLNKKLTSVQFAFSREVNKQYVMDLLKNNAKQIANALENNATIMVCGSLAMQCDVELVLEEITQMHLKKSFDYYKNNNQFLTDCY